MRFIGGDHHAEPVPAEKQHLFVIDFPAGRATLRYMRHGDYFVIFGMSPANAADRIAELEDSCK